MSEHPISDEIGANLAAFVDSGAGPRHRDLTRVFSMSGYGLAARKLSSGCCRLI
jgi:hypothetical protein